MAPINGVLAADIESIDAPTWSPDGTQIAYHLEKQFGPFELAIFDLESEQQVESLLEGGAEASWSADGETIADTALQGLDIGAFDLTAGSGEVLAADPSDEQDPDWFA